MQTYWDGSQTTSSQEKATLLLDGSHVEPTVKWHQHQLSTSTRFQLVEKKGIGELQVVTV